LTLVRVGSGATVGEALARFRRRADVSYAEPDYEITTSATTPNDSRFGELWGMNNTGQSVNGHPAGQPDADIDAPEAWDLTTGSAAIKVAVLDTGVALDHPDLAPNIWTNPGEVPGNGKDDDGNGFVDDVHGWDFADGSNNPQDENGHGSHVAGTIGAAGNNDAAGAGPTDVVGVNWHVALMPVRILAADGTGFVSDEVSGINYAMQNGARVVNMSFGHPDFSQAEHDAIAAATNTLFVTAAGNDMLSVDTNPTYPCSLGLPNMLCVAATRGDDRLASFSNYGNTVDIAAPGLDVLSTYPYHVVLHESFEQGSIQPPWAAGGSPNTWGVTSVAASEDSLSITDSQGSNYVANADNWVRGGPFNLSAFDSCRLSFDALINSATHDDLTAEASSSLTGPWSTVATWPGNSTLIPYAGHSDVSLPVSSSEYIRFHFVSDATDQRDGVYVDAVEIRCHGAYDGTNYRFLSGTSMATPHVAGAAALVLSRFPTLTVSQLRTRIFNGADAKTTLTQISGSRRLNLYGAVANRASTVDAGTDQTVNTATTVTLHGSASDPENDPITVTWAQTLGPAVTLDDRHKLQPTFTAPSSAATLRFALTASTATGPDVTDTVTVTVKKPK
jgi:subtilisin family serine protease